MIPAPQPRQKRAEPDVDATGLRLVRELGRGGFGVTFLAEVMEPSLQAEFGAQEVALKIPRDPAAAMALRREILTMARIAEDLRGLPQENLVRFLGFLPFEGVISLVMELVRGGSLRARLGGIGHQRFLDADAAVGIADGVFAGLAMLHANRVVHRDIKPENILMNGDVPKIADLGISRIVQAGELVNTRAGTVFYMSPESLDGDCGPAADLWATGVTLYELIAGRLPFGSPQDPLMAVVRQIQKATFTPLRQARPAVSFAVAEAVERLLHRDPAQRFGSAAEARLALRPTTPTTSSVLRELSERERAGHAAATIEADLRAALAGEPASLDLMRALASFLARRLRHDEAVAVLEQVVSRSPESGEAWLDLSVAFRASGRAPEAHRAAERAVTIGVPPTREREARFTLKASATRLADRPGMVPPASAPPAERELADLRDRLNAGDPSVEHDLRALVARVPADGRVHQYLGEFLCRMMRPAEAIDALRAGAVAAPSFGPLHWSLGMVLQSEGRPSEAAQALQQALDLPIDANMRRNAEVLLKRLGLP